MTGFASWLHDLNAEDPDLTALNRYAPNSDQKWCSATNDAKCRYCCKSRKLMSDKFLAGILNKPQSPIDVAAGSLPKSPVSLSLDDEVPHIFIRKSRLWPREFLISV